MWSMSFYRSSESCGTPPARNLSQKTAVVTVVLKKAVADPDESKNSLTDLELDISVDSD